MTSLYRQETQVRAVKSWLERKQLAGVFSRAFPVPMSFFPLGHHHPWAPEQPGCREGGGQGYRASSMPACYPGHTPTPSGENPPVLQMRKFGLKEAKWPAPTGAARMQELQPNTDP